MELLYRQETQQEGDPTLDRRRQRHYIHKRESRQRGNTAGHNLTDETGKQNRTSPAQDYHNKTGHTLRHRLYK